MACILTYLCSLPLLQARIQELEGALHSAHFSSISLQRVLLRQSSFDGTDLHSDEEKQSPGLACSCSTLRKAPSSCLERQRAA